MSLAERLAETRARLDRACREHGRDPGEVALLAVSKTRDAAAIRAAEKLGQRAFGENRVQELVAKARELADSGVQWHMIGSVQTNKVRALLQAPGLALLHSVDRHKLADRLQDELADREPLDVLLQINATGEAQKHGVLPGDTPALAEHLAGDCPGLHLRGLMGMAPLQGEPDAAFEAVAALRDRLQDRLGAPLPELSLGMTRDLEAAVAAGSTLVRVGTGIFGPRES